MGISHFEYFPLVFLGFLIYYFFLLIFNERFIDIIGRTIESKNKIGERMTKEDFKYVEDNKLN
jgi:hypothetical protein